MSEDISEDAEASAAGPLVFTATAEQEGMRLDRALADLCPDLSRVRFQQLIRQGGVTLGGVALTDPKRRLRAGERLVADLEAAGTRPRSNAPPVPEDIPLDIVYEDEELMVVNKPPGLVVHPGAGNWTGTLANALAHYCGGALPAAGGNDRPGIVHRLDKDTSGLMLVARSERAHSRLSAALAARDIHRVYMALVWGVPVPVAGRIDTGYGRDARSRTRMRVLRPGEGRQAVTRYKCLRSSGTAVSLAECRLETGRTHQIRVHMAHLGHPIVGDPVYGLAPARARQLARKGGLDDGTAEKLIGFPRQALHAAALSFVHPVSGESMSFDVPPPPDMALLLAGC